MKDLLRITVVVVILLCSNALVPPQMLRRAVKVDNPNRFGTSGITASQEPLKSGHNRVHVRYGGSLFGPLQSTKSLSIALDRSVVPRGIFSGSIGKFFVLGFVLNQYLKFRAARVAARAGEDDDEYYDDGEDSDDSNFGGRGRAFVRGVLPSLVSKARDTVVSYAERAFSTLYSVAQLPFVSAALFLTLCFKVVVAKAYYVTELVGSVVSEFVEFDPADTLDIQDWKICVLDERELLEGGIVRYRFGLANDNAVLPLTVGQELVLCAVDARDKVLKSTFYPVSRTKERGSFEVLVDRSHSSVEANAFNRNLDTLALGDEIAFKGGRGRLTYLGPDAVYGISVAASHLGIAPALQLLRGVLGDRRSAIEDTELLWLNEHEEDFVCQEDVEALEYRHIEKLAVSRIVEEDLYASAFAKSEPVQQAITPYDEGRLGVICAPDYIVPGLRKLFQDLGYPSDNIITVPIA